MITTSLPDGAKLHSDLPTRSVEYSRTLNPDLSFPRDGSEIAAWLGGAAFTNHQPVGQHLIPLLNQGSMLFEKRSDLAWLVPTISSRIGTWTLSASSLDACQCSNFRKPKLAFFAIISFGH